MTHSRQALIKALRLIKEDLRVWHGAVAHVMSLNCIPLDSNYCKEDQTAILDLCREEFPEFQFELHRDTFLLCLEKD